METQPDFGISVISVTPLAPLPENAKFEITYRVRTRVLAFGQEAYFDVEIAAHGLDEAAQRAYGKWGAAFDSLSKGATAASDILLRRAGSAT